MMDSIKSECTINPLASTLIFQHKNEARRVFSDVIGLHDIDHIALTTISPQQELTFLSYRPSIEYDLITSNLWTYDRSYHPDFFQQKQGKLWTDLYHKDKYAELMHIKQQSKHLSTGLSTALSYKHCKLLLSFATKSKHMEAEQRLLEAHAELVQMGRYCFQALSHIFMPYLLGKTTETKKSRITSPYMRLIVNNTTEREHS